MYGRYVGGKGGGGKLGNAQRPDARFDVGVEEMLAGRKAGPVSGGTARGNDRLAGGTAYRRGGICVAISLLLGGSGGGGGGVETTATTTRYCVGHCFFLSWGLLLAGGAMTCW